MTYNAQGAGVTNNERNCSVYISGNLIGILTNITTSDTFTVDKDYFINPNSVSYTGCGQNISNTTFRYLGLTSCDYTADAYSAMDTTYELNFTAMGLLPVIILIMAAVAVIGAVLVLRRR